MKLVVRLKLATLECANDDANTISETAWVTRVFGQYALHQLCYHEIRARFALGAQITVRLFAKVADADKRDRERTRIFRSHGSVAYEDRNLKYFPERVSLWTVTGRRTIAFVGDERKRKLLKDRQGETALVYRDGAWYLSTGGKVSSWS